ncbi:MAG: hypothetical protein V3V02_05250 [Rhizobiaceae bacterium]
MIFKIIGGILIAWSLADVVGNLMGVAVWKDWFGISLTGLVYQLTGWVSLLGGAVLWRKGSREKSGVKAGGEVNG